MWSDDSIWLSDSRQGGAKVKLSKQRMEADIEMQRLLRDYDFVLKRVEALVGIMKATGNAEIRKELREEVQKLDRKGCELQDQMSFLDKLD
jgi:hypothetical protein